MLLLFIICLIGLIHGIVVGLLPGLGITSTLVMASFFLYNFDPVWIILYYICVITACQYFGTITSIYTGIPGEISSVPSSTESAGFKSNTRRQRVVNQSTIYSAVGFVVSLILFITSWYLVDNIAKSLTVTVQLLLLSMAIVVTVFSRINSRIINLLLIVLGLFVGSIGYSQFWQININTFDLIILETGLPWQGIILGLAFGELLNSKNNSISTNDRQVRSIWHNTRRYFNYLWPHGIIGSIIGFMLGLIPGLSYILSSNVSYSVSKWVSLRPRIGDIKSVVASESANNAGITAMLFPLFAWGLPITASESLIYNLVSANTFDIRALFLNNLESIVTVAVLVNLICIILCLTSSNQLVKINNIDKRWIITIVCALIIINFFISTEYENPLLLVSTFVIFFTMSRFFQSISFTPLLFMVVLWPSIESTVFQFVNLFF
jgi:putative tricarboxylic transport membrane protein